MSEHRAPGQPPPRSRYTLLGALGLSDVLVGLVLLFVGLSGDITALVVAGAVLAVVGAGMAATVSVLKNRPTQL